MGRYPYDPRFADYGWWHAGTILAILMFAVLIGVIVWAVLRLTRGGRPMLSGGPSGGNAALDEVRLRYARGEIDREEFVERFRDLGGVDVIRTPAAAVPPPAPDPTDPPPSAA